MNKSDPVIPNAATNPAPEMSTAGGATMFSNMPDRRLATGTPGDGGCLSIPGARDARMAMG